MGDRVSMRRNGNCTFTTMNSNRAINSDVVEERVRTNEHNFSFNNEYCEFGQINLLVVKSDPRPDFLIMDGQHRVETMKALVAKYPERECYFQFRAKVVSNENDAGRE